MKKNGVYKFILVVLFFHTTSLLHINHFSYADNSSNSQQEQLPLKNLRTAAQFEYYEKFGTINNTSSIQIEMPDLTWNITEIKLNFTNISQYRQIRTIESNISVSSFKPIYYSRWWDYIRRYGQQINFSEPTEVYGVYLYGFKTYIATEIVYVRLTGFDDITHKPNNTVYHSQLINISNVLGWYYQDFSSSPLTFYNDDYY